MNTRVRTAVQTMKAPAKLDNKVAKSPSLRKNVKERQELLLNRLANSQRTINPRTSSRDRKKALQQDVEKLKKKLRHEENVHRALERAFTRPLGALPRLPPYLPPQTLELLAEVAVLEEEVVRLEEKVVNFRQGLYQEALYISSSKSTESTSDSFEQSSNSFKLEQSKSFAQVVDLDAAVSQPLHSMIDGPAKPPVDQSGHSSSPPVKGNKNLKKNNSPSVFCEGKENQSNANSTIKCKQASLQKTKRKNTFRKKLHLESDASENCSEPIQPENRAMAQERAEDSPASGISMSLSTQENPNKIAEDVLKCLMSIFSRMNNPKATALEPEMPISASRFTSCEGSEATQFGDPYGMCFDFGEREIGPYKHLQAIEGSSVVPDWITSSSFLIQRLKCLLSRLASVDLRGLTHQQKLAFWINVYNSCMMNAYLEHGIPGSPQLVVALIQKAMINVSGHLLNALTIEHFILRLPYSKYTNPKGVKNDDAAMRSIFSLDWPEPLVTFALSCGSWSSPAVRVYSATHVENELEIAKRDYLQAAIGISLTKVAIPKLLDCYLLDFAKDIESLLDWICLQLPDEMRKDAIKCLERGREEKTSQWVYVSPYEFCFRYLLGP